MSARNGAAQMRRATRHGAGQGPLSKRFTGRAGRRAATFVEFAIVLPIFVFMMLFTIDMGTVILMSGAMNDSSFSAARAGAQKGGGELGGVSEATFNEALKQIPFSATLHETKDFSVVTGKTCTRNDRIVTVKVTYGLNLITPGLDSMLRVMSNDDTAGIDGFVLTAHGVARCEVYRQ